MGLEQVALETPDQRSLHYGISRTDLPQRIEALIDGIVFEHNRTDEDSTGSCMEYVLKADGECWLSLSVFGVHPALTRFAVLGTLVELSEGDKPAGIKKEVIRALANLTILLDERFLSRQPIHQAVQALMRSCIGDEEAEVDEDEWMFEDESAASARFAKSAGVQGQDYEEDLVDLICHICSRIRNAPHLLNIFLKSVKKTIPPARPASPADSESSASTLRAGAVSPTPANGHRPVVEETLVERFRFPIFSYLLRFIHREGKIGEVARAGAIFITNLALGKVPEGKELSNHNLVLAQIIRDSDFAEVFGASLGAVFGLLPSKLAIWRPPQFVETKNASAPTVVSMGMSIGTEPRTEQERAQRTEQMAAQGVEFSGSDFVIGQVKLLASLLEFAQDVLVAALEAAVDGEETLAECATSIGRQISLAIRNNFLQNILYPSMLECNDSDWSAVAVMTYIETMLVCIDDMNPLADVIIGYLVAEEQGSGSSSQEKKKRRKSTALLMVESNSNHPTSYFTDAMGRYTLKDLIMGHVTPTTSPETLTAALRLATTLFERHGRFAIKYLTSPILDPRSTAFLRDAPIVSVEQHLVDMRLISSLVDSSGTASSSFGFEQSLYDVEESLSRNSLFQLGMQTYASEGDSATIVSAIDGLRHRIDPTDRFYRTLVESLAHFFLRSPEINVALTSAIATISLDPLRSIDGWLVSGSEQEDVPILIAVLHALAQQSEAMRKSIPEFDQLLSERRSGLIYVDKLHDAIAVDQDDELMLGSTSPLAPEPDTSHVDPKRLALAMNRLDSSEPCEIKVERTETAPAEPATVPQEVETEAPKPREGFARWFVGSRSKPKATTAPMSRDHSKGEAAVPFGDHYARTEAIRLEARPAKLPDGPWTGSRHNRKRLRFGPANEEDEDVVYPGRAAAASEAKMVNLSEVLDNVIILQETIKELAAVIQTRRSVGIDALDLPV